MGQTRNVLFIMSDQLRHDYLSCMGARHISTPHLDRLAKMGTLFRRAYCPSGVCGPSRMSFYTGRSATSHGATWNSVPLSVRELTLGDYLRPMGIRVALAGKTHALPDLDGMTRLGIDPASERGRLLINAGFEPFDRHEGHVEPPPTSNYSEYLRAKGYDSERPWHEYANGVTLPDGSHDTGWWLRNSRFPLRVDKADSETAYMTDRALGFVAEQADKPWLLHLSYIKPHWPYCAPAPYHDMYGPEDAPALSRGKNERESAHPVVQAYYQHEEGKSFAREEVVNTVRPAYMGLVKELDDNIGRLLDGLEKMGRLDDTMIVFTADHGDYLGDHWLGEKEIFFEQAARIPMIVYDPADDAVRGQVDDTLIDGIDVVPTFLTALGAPAHDYVVEGRDLTPLLRGKGDDGRRDYAVCELDYAYRRARLVLDQPAQRCRAWMVRAERWKYVHWLDYPDQLYDLHNDPDEMVDFGVDPGHDKVRAEMRDRLVEWFTTRRIRTTAPDGFEADRTDSHTKRGIHIGEW
ncbi:MAG: sulfatase-like hydrolase/transferase [Alphaproteobacteria bacterium]